MRTLNNPHRYQQYTLRRGRGGLLFLANVADKACPVIRQAGDRDIPLSVAIRAHGSFQNDFRFRGLGIRTAKSPIIRVLRLETLESFLVFAPAHSFPSLTVGRGG